MAPELTAALVVGLGNPGPEYAGHRHNVGFMVLDLLARRHGLVFQRERWVWRAAGRVGGRPVELIKPRTFMNRSGRVLAARPGEDAPESAPSDHLLVVHDDLDLPFGTLRLKRAGGTGGHRGLRSIVDRVGPEFGRLRVGIDHPGDSADVTDYVLADFDPAEQEALPDVLGRAVDAVQRVLEDGLDATMNEINRKINNLSG